MIFKDLNHLTPLTDKAVPIFATIVAAWNFTSMNSILAVLIGGLTLVHLIIRIRIGLKELRELKGGSKDD